MRNYSAVALHAVETVEREPSVANLRIPDARVVGRTRVDLNGPVGGRITWHSEVIGSRQSRWNDLTVPVAEMADSTVLPARSDPSHEMIHAGGRVDTRTIDFKTEITGGQIAVPAEIAAQVPPGKQIQVVLSWGDSEYEAAWREAGRRQFEAAYAADDAIYESLINDPPTR